MPKHLSGVGQEVVKGEKKMREVCEGREEVCEGRERVCEGREVGEGGRRCGEGQEYDIMIHDL